MLFAYIYVSIVGKYLILVPFRSAYEPKNGQRGFGLVPQIDLNLFFSLSNPPLLASALSNITLTDLTATTRYQQIPSVVDTELRGFSGGFATGQFVVMVPFFNGVFSGKLARFQLNPTPSGVYGSSSGSSGSLVVNASKTVQELDLTNDRNRPGVYRAYRGGFVSLWQAVYP